MIYIEFYLEIQNLNLVAESGKNMVTLVIFSLLFLDVVIGDWKNNERLITYQVFINNPLVKGDHAKCIEKLKLLKNEQKKCFVVSAEGSTPDIMYGDSFTVLSLYCLTRGDGENKSKLRISIGKKV